MNYWAGNTNLHGGISACSGDRRAEPCGTGGHAQVPEKDMPRSRLPE